ncbi:hypothetical protein [Lacinutrix sp. Hel_I_90]|uniref:hypothetical protein n=1 Tax=Lacinutrix sp. Hel_I_90 TaxID=1249999 RepID=UPI0005CA117A|nr:hypothetical protein [Lacinutrix sp. Hel_I_90]
MNHLLTIPLAVFCSLNFVFQGETTNQLEAATSPSFNDTTINNNSAITKAGIEDFTNPVIIHNADVGIFPGDRNQGRAFIPRTRISALEMREDMIVTGIKAADDGQQLIIFANHNNIILLANNSNSSSGNRIEQNSNMIIQQGKAFELTYSVAANKWIITNDDF